MSLTSSGLRHLAWTIAALTVIPLASEPGEAQATPADRRVVLPTLGVALLAPTTLALDVGLNYRRDSSTRPFLAPVAAAEIGLGGVAGRAGVAWHWPFNTDWGGPGGERLLRVHTVWLRAWGHPLVVDPGESLRGLEAQVMVLVFGFRVVRWTSPTGTRSPFWMFSFVIGAQ